VLLGLDVGDNGSSSGSGALSDGSDVAGDGSGVMLGGFGVSSFSLGTLEGSGFGSLDSRSVSLGPLDVVLAGNNLGGVSFLGGSPCGLHFGESSGGFSDSSGSGVDGSFVGGSGSITSLEAEFSVVAGGLPFGEGTGSFLAHSFLVGDSRDVHGFGSSGETLGLLHGGVESGSGFLGGRLSISGTEVLSDLEGAVSREDLLLADVLGSHSLSLGHVSGTIEERHSREASHDGCGFFGFRRAGFFAGDKHVFRILLAFTSSSPSFALFNNILLKDSIAPTCARFSTIICTVAFFLGI